MTYSLFRIGAGKVWHYRFQVAGKRVQRSTRETAKARAAPIASAAYQAAVARANGGQPVPTLRALGRDWLKVHGPVVSAHHHAAVERFLRLHLYDLGDTPICDLATEAVEMARNEHLKEHRPASANHWLRNLKLLTLWAVKRGILDKSPWQVKMIKVQKKPRPTLPLDVAQAWFANIDQASPRQAAIGLAVRMMFGLGLRESEVLTARWEWIDWQRRTYTPGRTKGKEADPVPMPEWLAERLLPQRQSAGLIVCRADGQAFSSGFARAAIAKANAASLVMGITPHRLRGTFATLLSENGVPIQTIRDVMRHKSFMTTMGYLEANLTTAARAQDRIAQKAGFGGEKVASETAESP